MGNGAPGHRDRASAAHGDDRGVTHRVGAAQGNEHRHRKVGSPSGDDHDDHGDEEAAD